MLRFKIISLLLGVAMPLALDATERYYSEPLSMEEGTVLTETVPSGLLSWNYHCRVQSGRTKKPQWSFVINGRDKRRHILTISRAGSKVAETDYARPVEVTLKDNNGQTVKKFTVVRGVESSVDVLSMVLEKRAGCDSVECRIGQTVPLLEFTALSADDVASITLRTESPLGLLRLSLTGDEAEKYGVAAFKSVTELGEYLSASSNQSERVWRYLDRDTDARVLNLGGEYSLATVSNADGGYDIVYIDGARVNGAYWKPLKIKGRLLPTVFVNHYDLIWYDAYGHAIDRETSADIENGSILKLNFPLYGGSVRFAAEIGK